MGKITRLHSSDIANGFVADASYINDELNQLVETVNTNLDESEAYADSIVNNAVKTMTIAAGTDFPEGPYTSGQLFWRTDEKKMYAYNLNTAQFEPVIPPLSDTDILNQLKNVDGTGSGLDADLVKGYTAYTTNNKPSVSGSYTGDGTSNRFIDVGFAPSAVLLLPANAFNESYSDGGLATVSSPATYGSAGTIMNISGNGFNVYCDTNAANSSYHKRTNYNGNIYNYIAWK